MSNGLLNPSWPPSLTPKCFWLWVCMVTGACPSSASPSTWRSPAHHLRPCLWAEEWPAQCPRSRSRWSQTMSQTSTITALGTWAVRLHYKAETRRLVDRKHTTKCLQTTRCSQCWPTDSTRLHRLNRHLNRLAKMRLIQLLSLEKFEFWQHLLLNGCIFDRFYFQ